MQKLEAKGDACTKCQCAPTSNTSLKRTLISVFFYLLCVSVCFCQALRPFSLKGPGASLTLLRVHGSPATSCHAKSPLRNRHCCRAYAVVFYEAYLINRPDRAGCSCPISTTMSKKSSRAVSPGPSPRHRNSDTAAAQSPNTMAKVRLMLHGTVLLRMGSQTARCP